MVEPTSTAVSLMKMALALLDRDGDTTAALHLQHAIDVAMKTPNLKPGDELPADLVDRFLPPPDGE